MGQHYFPDGLIPEALNLDHKGMDLLGSVLIYLSRHSLYFLRLLFYMSYNTFSFRAHRWFVR